MSNRASNPPATTSVACRGKAPSRALARLRGAIVAALVLPLFIVLAMIGYFYWDAFAEARQDLTSAAHIVQEHAQKMLETNEALLGRMLDLFGESTDTELLAQGAALHERLRAMTSNFSQVQGFFSIGADGRMLATNRAFPPPRHIDFADREFIAAHRTGTGTRVFITGSLVSRVTGEAFFDMSRRRTLADGSYGGTVNVALHPNYLTRFWSELTATIPGLRAALLRADGRLIARYPDAVSEGAVVPAEHPLMRPINAGAVSGSFDHDSPFDGVRRLGAFRKVGDYPVYIVTAFDHALVLGHWIRRAAWLVVLVVPLASALAWMSWIALKRTREEIDAATRLEAETMRRGRAEEALLQAQKLEALGRLTGGVAHDFNNILAVVGNNVQLLQLSPLAEQREAALAAIARSVRAGSKLTGQLLAFARRQPMYPERIVLQEEVEAWSALVKPILSNRIEIELRSERDAPAVLVDRAGLELAILNLALNAVDAMPSGGKLRITVRRGTAEESRELGGECSVVEVADTGSGMTPEVLERIFDPFFTTKPVGKGTGLGLSQVYGFCEQAGCIVRAQSAPGEGTTIRMYLRVAPAAVSGSTERTPASAPLPRSVLLVDDNVEVAQGMAAVLRQSGCEVQYAQSAEAALAILESRARDFDVLLSDIVMPDTSGIDLALRVRSRWPKLSIVLMTGHAMGDTEPPSGMPVLRKPFELQELAAAVAANSRADESAMRYYG